MSAWKKPVANGLAEEALQHDARQHFAIMPGRVDRLQLVQLDAVDPLHREHIAVGVIPFGNRNAEFLVLLGILREFGERGGLEAQIHLDGDGTCERLHDLAHAQPACLRRDRLGETGGEAHCLEIAGEASAYARPYDLHGHGLVTLSRLQQRLVHLGDRGCRDGRAEFGKDRADRTPERLGERCFRKLLRERFHTVLQGLEIARSGKADDIRARGKELAEFHIGRARAAPWPWPCAPGRFPAPLRSNIRAIFSPSWAIGGSGCGSTREKTPSRART